MTPSIIPPSIIPPSIIPLTTIIDCVGLLSGLTASWLWYLSGRRRVRRVSQFEPIDASDLNRLVVAINRTSILNARAALAAAISSASLALRLGIDLAGG